MQVLMHIKAQALLCAAPLLWAGNFIVGHAVEGELTPLHLNALRWACAALLLVPVLVLHRRSAWAAVRYNLAGLACLTGLGVIGFNLVLYAGLARMEAGQAGILFGLTPILVILIARGLGGPDVPRRVWTGAAMAVFGVGMALWPSVGHVHLATSGAALVLGAACIWAAYTVALKRLLLHVPALVTLALTAWGGTLVLMPLALATGVTEVALDAREMQLAILYLGVGASVLAFFAWQLGIRAVGPIKGGLYLNLIPVFGVVLAAMFLDEPLTFVRVCALALVVAGVAVAQAARIPAPRMPLVLSRAWAVG